MAQNENIQEMKAQDVPPGGLIGTGGGFYVLISQEPSIALAIHDRDDDGQTPTVELDPYATVFLHTGKMRTRHQELFATHWQVARAQHPDLADILA